MSNFLYISDDPNNREIVVNLDRVTYSTYDGNDVAIFFEDKRSISVTGEEAGRIWGLLINELPDAQIISGSERALASTAPTLDELKKQHVDIEGVQKH